MDTLKLPAIEACVFDAYGTLFDVASAARSMADDLGGQWRPLAEMWRRKQLQYTWLRSLGGHYADFWQVTGEALDFALESLSLMDARLRDRLMELYLCLEPYPEVPLTLRSLKDGGMKLAILSNGSPAMLDAAIRNAGIGELLDCVLSVDEVRVFKPHPDVYRLVPDRLGAAGEAVCFLSANGWDAYAAKAYGFRVLWCNRYGQPRERIPRRPDGEIPTLESLADIVLPPEEPEGLIQAQTPTE